MFMLADNVEGYGYVYPSKYVFFMCIHICDLFLCLCVCLSTCVLFHLYICVEDCGEEGFFLKT